MNDYRQPQGVQFGKPQGKNYLREFLGGLGTDMEGLGQINPSWLIMNAPEMAMRQQQFDIERDQTDAFRELSQIPNRGGGNPNIRGRFGAGQGSYVGPDMQMLDRQRNPGQFQPPERPRIVNNLTQLLRPYPG